MAVTKEIREQKVAEATEKWLEMETSELLDELKDLEEMEELCLKKGLLSGLLKKLLKKL